MTTSGGEAAAADDGAVEAPTVADGGLTEPAGADVDTAGAEQAATTTTTATPKAARRCVTGRFICGPSILAAVIDLRAGVPMIVP